MRFSTFIVATISLSIQYVVAFPSYRYGNSQQVIKAGDIIHGRLNKLVPAPEPAHHDDDYDHTSLEEMIVLDVNPVANSYTVVYTSETLTVDYILGKDVGPSAEHCGKIYTQRYTYAHEHIEWIAGDSITIEEVDVIEQLLEEKGFDDMEPTDNYVGQLGLDG